MNTNNNPILTNEVFQRLRKFASDNIGMELLELKKNHILYGIKKRMRLLDVRTVEDYINYMEHNFDEATLFINIITNCTTGFFRENYHFDYLASNILPDLIKHKKRIRLWSAGCSSGEEAYSLAMVVCESVPDITQHDIKILATDINTEALRVAERGIYNIRKIDTLSNRMQWLHEDPRHDNIHYEVNDSVKSLVRIRKLNLLESWPMKGLFDVVFFRNVSIYMTQPTIDTVLSKFDSVIEKGGFLVLGHSESLGYKLNHYDSMGKNIFQKLE